MNDLTAQPHDLPARHESPDVDHLFDVTLGTMAQSSRRVYAQTYTTWCTWCENTGVSPIDINFGNVRAFLIDQHVTRITRERQLAALRKAAEMLSIMDYGNPARKASYDLLVKLKLPTENLSEDERPKVALTPEESLAAIQVWDGYQLREIRNRAIIATLLLTGLRRSELAALTWQDIDLVNGVIQVRQGKGGKDRDVAVYGDLALDALKQWRMILGEDREYVFCPTTRGDTLGDDKPITPETVYRVVKETEQRAGLDHFSPHDARRTLITELLETGSPVHEVQDQAGHADGKMTLHYAQSTDARQRRRKRHVRYGNG